MESLVVLVWTLILVIGNKTRFTAIQPVTQKPRDLPDAGFTLIELLVAIAVMAVVLGLAVLAFPNHDERYWRDNLDQLTASLNMAQEESAMAGSVIVAQVDALGWRFLFQPVRLVIWRRHPTTMQAQPFQMLAV